MKSLSYDDILLYPQHGVVASRSEVDISATLNGWKFRMPVMSSPMETVTDNNFAVKMHQAGCLGVIHRFSREGDHKFKFDKVDERFRNNNYHPHAIAISGTELYRLDWLPDYIDIAVLDVAHADTKVMLKGVDDFKRRYPDKFLIVGSIATYNAARRAINAGADALRVGIGAGAACTTRTVTGFGVPMVTSIQEVANVAQPHDIPVIADGGIKTTGDVVKALAVGADWVMMGRMFAGVEESPHGTEYFGQASPKSAAHTGRHVEGAVGKVAPQGSLSSVLDQIEDAIRSGVSYGGGRTIEEMRQRTVIQEVSPLAMVENGVRF